MKLVRRSASLKLIIRVVMQHEAGKKCCQHEAGKKSGQHDAGKKSGQHELVRRVASMNW